MPWVPKTDFEEEIVNLQPNHDFIYGALSETQYNYPRPQAHVEYAFNRKMQKKEQEENGTANKMNRKLHAIMQIQRMANTKPLGEQPAIDDWDNNGKIEQETIGMLRYHGLPLSIEQPFNENVTIATFPVENTIKVVRNGRKKVAYFFDDNVFQLKEKVSNSSSGFKGCTGKDSNDYLHNANDSLVSDIGDVNDRLRDTSSLLSRHSFGTCWNSDLIKPSTFGMASDESSDQQSTLWNAESLWQYEKLLEDTASLSLNSSNTTNSTDSFKTSEDHHTTWRPILSDEDILNNCENWPDLLNNKRSVCNNSILCSNNLHNNSQSNLDDISDTDVSDSSNSSHKGEHFLDRFIKPEHVDTSTTTTSLPASSCEPLTYAAIIKKNKETTSISPEQPEKSEFLPFYTPRKMYALKRQVK